jgi:hypothetical protein
MKGFGKPPEPLSRVLASVLTGFGTDPPVPLTIMQAWDAVVGEGISRKARPFKLVRQTLFLKVASNAWMTEIQMRSPTILEGLNEKLGRKRIGALRFELGLIPPSRPMGVPDPLSVPSDAPSLEDQDVPPKIDEALSKLDDGPLRKQVEAVLARSLNRNSRK